MIIRYWPKIRQLISALQRYYRRTYSGFHELVNTSNGVVNGAVGPDHINEPRRGNNYVLLAASHLNHYNNLTSLLYVGSNNFFFETTFDGVTDFLVLIDVAELHGVVDYDRLMPKVVLRRPGKHKNVVCRSKDIVCNSYSITFSGNCYTRRWDNASNL
ncbi:uncharacterized protein EV154DRAFT_481557 [Mucor mucedo]|uniref:uncharacterized protein n=1 Tax=Mucor mucedo TaxID=29922 RepID=UPI00221F9B87|nr:uncharacterized protein EV154DRAFT_481557 [Mucor mucedo]KAI7891041.1 hypothetical protein EV154DRAFT_481557 [Mucor mucedo]